MSKIKICSQEYCNFKCEEFASDGFIYVNSREVEEVKKADHLVRFSELGKPHNRFQCKAKNRANCDCGIKPDHCNIYPLWFGNEIMISSRCPIVNEPKEILKAHFQHAYNINLDNFKDWNLLKNYKVNSYIKYDIQVEKLQVSDVQELHKHELLFKDDSMVIGSTFQEISNCLLSGYSYCVKYKGRIVAYILCFINNGSLEIEKWNVCDKGFLGWGFQFILGKLIITIARNNGIGYAATYVSDKNSYSLKNVHKLGFITQGTKFVNNSPRNYMLCKL